MTKEITYNTVSESFASAKIAVFAPVEGVIFKNHIYHIKDRCLKNIKQLWFMLYFTYQVGNLSLKIKFI